MVFTESSALNGGRWFTPWSPRSAWLLCVSMATLCCHLTEFGRLCFYLFSCLKAWMPSGRLPPSTAVSLFYIPKFNFQIHSLGGAVPLPGLQHVTDGAPKLQFTADTKSSETRNPSAMEAVTHALNLTTGVFYSCFLLWKCKLLDSDVAFSENIVMLCKDLWIAYLNFIFNLGF